MNDEVMNIVVDDTLFGTTIPMMLADTKKQSTQIKEKMAALSDAINNITVNDDLLAGFKVAEDAYRDTIRTFNSTYITSLEELSKLMTATFLKIFMGFEEEKYPIDERLDKVESYLPTTNLHQYRYLDILSFTKGMKEAVQRNMLKDAEPENCCYIDPIDMYVKTILTRTIVYLRRLKEGDLLDAPLSVIGVVGIYGDVLSTNVAEDINSVGEMLDKVSEKIPETVSEPNQVNNIKAASVIITDRIRDTIIPLIDAVIDTINVYEKLLGVMKDSNEAIQKAYALYKEACAITF